MKTLSLSEGIEKGIDDQELLSGREMLFDDERVSVYHPLRPAIPESEGIQLVVRSAHKGSPRDGLSEMFYGMAVAKVISQGRYTEDFWVNIHSNAHPGTEEGINVFGRNPLSTEAWGKPVQIRDISQRQEHSLKPQQLAQLHRTMERYIPLWEQAGARITLFDDGVSDIAPTDREFTDEQAKWLEKPNPWQEQVVWMNDKFVLVVVLHPHLKGIHLVCHARDSYWGDKDKVSRENFTMSGKYPVKAWETPSRPEGALDYLCGTVENYAILLGAKEILGRQGIGGQPICNSEIHFSGNWGFIPLDSTNLVTRGRTVETNRFTSREGDEKERERKVQKRQSFNTEWGSEYPGWGSHGHLYATYSAGEYVDLTSRPRAEKPEEWRAIPDASPAEVSQIQSAVQAKLTTWLTEQFAGKTII